MEMILLEKSSYLSRSNWVERTPLSSELKDSVLTSEILFLPIENFRGLSERAFPQGTSDLFRYIKEKARHLAGTELCISECEYQELALYSKEIRLGHFLVTQLVAPVLIGLLTSYVYDNLKAEPDDKISVTIQIEGKCNDYKFTFDGLSKDFNSIGSKIMQNVDSCENTDNNQIEFRDENEITKI